MSRFERFELPVNKIQEYPLVFEAVIPDGCSLFQDIRRYQSVTADLDVRIIDMEGKIPLEPGMIPVPMAKLSKGEKKAFIEYLKLRITRGDNIGSSWVFFRSPEKKKPVVAFGANVVYRDSETGHARAIHLLKEMQKSGPKTKFFTKILVVLILAAILGVGGYYGYNRFVGGKTFDMTKYLPGGPDSKEMAFYESMFPDVYQWLSSDVVDLRVLAQDLLKPEYIREIISFMKKDFHEDRDNKENFRGNRLALFVYFNYNEEIKATLNKYRVKLDDTEFGRLSRIYSCKESGYTSNIFYFKVGDLEVKPPRINQFLTENMIAYNDYTRLRDADGFSHMLKKDSINSRLKTFLSDVYTFSPLKVENPVEDIDWYLLVQRSSSGRLDFAAFFKRGESTLIPREISNRLMDYRWVPPADTAEKKGAVQIETGFMWYQIDYDQKRSLNLSNNAIGYFTEKIGQASKLEVVDRKIKELSLEKIKGDFPVVIHRELLMEDSKGKYGVQCFDPLTSLVFSNIITKSSFEKISNLSLKRDPIQINTSMVQLSKDDSTSTQAINISPGKTGIVNMFRKVDFFRAKLANGESVKFQREDVNLFNPFSFMVHSDSITFNYRHEINGMEFVIKKAAFKIETSGDGGYQIIEVK